MVMVTSSFEPFGPVQPVPPFVPPPGMRLQEYALAHDDGRHCTVYLAAHDHGAAFGDAYLFDGKDWKQVATGKTQFETTQKLEAFYDEARAGIATWNFRHDHAEHRYVATGLLFDVKNGLSPITTRGDDPIAEPEDDTTGTFDYMGLFATDARRAVTVCLTRRGVWELDADAVWRKCVDTDLATFPMQWDDDGAGSAFDALNARAVFWFYTRAPAREYAFYAWDGRTLSRLSAAGLPMKDLHVGLFNPAATIGAHPKHGIVLLAGSHGAFACGASGWTALPKMRGDVPPRIKNARMVFDPNAPGFIVGPGYHEGDAGGQEQQRIFFIERDGTWERFGTKIEQSALKDLWPKKRHVSSRGVWYAIATGDAQTLGWTDAGFEELVTKKLGEKALDKEKVDAVIDANGRCLAITTRGSVFELVGRAERPQPSPGFGGEARTWKRVCGNFKPFGERVDTCAAWDAANERVVVWGGSVKNRATNDTFFFERGAWRQSKKSSALPKDKRGRNDPHVDFTAVFDAALGRVVRFGGEDVALLDGDVWTRLAPKDYSKLFGPRSWTHFSAHDARTGETLLVNLESGVVARFEPSACTPVGKLTLPAELAYAAIRETLCFDPSSALLHAQDPDVAARRYAVDLRPLFDAAHALGPREILPAEAIDAPAPFEARLYHPKKRLFWFADGASATSGTIGEAPTTKEPIDDARDALAKKKKEGFVAAAKLTAVALADFGARASRALTVGKKSKTGKSASSRVGGLPSVDAKRWPSIDGAPAGFLVQVEGKGILREHAGVAIFCKTDGTATEDDENNVALLVTKADWKKKPAKPPAGVATLAIRPITIGKERPELDDAEVRALSAADPAMAAAFDRFQSKAKVQSETASKIGGSPQFLQGSEMRGNYTFFCQIDFDGIKLEEEWGLAGCVYVFVNADETEAIAFWQYT